MEQGDRKRKWDGKDEGDHVAKKVANHYNQVPEVGIVKRMDSRIFFMRNFNNWTKSQVIDETLRRIKESRNDWRAPITVLDIGCGKGGDLRKYKIGRIRHLICTDIAETSLSQAEDRYREMQSFQGGRGGWRGGHQNNNNNNSNLFTAEFIPADATKDCLRDKFRDPNVKIDMVSVQFSFHYCFESLEQVERMLENISDNLVDGGYFIGTTPDSNEILRRVRESNPNRTKKPVREEHDDEEEEEETEKDTDAAGSEDKEEEEEPESGHGFGNEIYSITFKEGVIKPNEPPPLFGAMYNFHLEEVVDCPEFLVHFPCLEKLAAKYGLKLVYKQRFDEFYKDRTTFTESSDDRRVKEARDLLKRMKALETYPPFTGDPIGTDPDDYTHAQEALDRIKDRDGDQRDERRGRIAVGKSVGTLSKSEWEATTLYLVFMFQKNPREGNGSTERTGNTERTEGKRQRISW